jgi:putative restriction endonuclease
MTQLPSLLRKAAGDAGFDLELEAESGWRRLSVSGVPGAVWVRPEAGGALLALPSAGHLSEVEEPAAAATGLPTGAAGAVACGSPGALFRALRRVRLLLAQRPPLPEKKLAERLAAITSTEVEDVVRQRVGQDVFRAALLEYWEGRCAVTGLNVPELLRASHAKPWKDATDAERLDVHNGLLLAVHLDALFDSGLISFTDDGAALLSPLLRDGVLGALGLGTGVPPLRRVAHAHEPYLTYHREFVFRRE